MMKQFCMKIDLISQRRENVLLLLYPGSQRFFWLMKERKAKRQNVREPLGAHIRSFEHANPN